MIIYDATDLVLGRLAATAAKKAMLGEQVAVVNCEHAVISGSRANILKRYFHKRSRTTPAKGPFIPRMPDRFVRRAIRGMLPHRKSRGEDAFERIMCYIGVPKQFEGKQMETIKNANISERQLTRYTNVLEVCKQLGAKI